MRRIFVSAAAMMAIASSAFAQSVPAAPPATFAVVQMAQNEQMTGFVEVTHIEPASAGVGHLWMLTVLRQPVQLPAGAVDAVWTYYEVTCAEGEFARVTAFHVTASGDLVDSSGPGQRRPISDGSPLAAGRDAACSGVAVAGDRVIDLDSAMALGRGPR